MFCFSQLTNKLIDWLIYSAFIQRLVSKSSDMDHTVFLQTTPCLLFLRKRSPDGASIECGGEHLTAAHYSFIDPERMKGWVDLVGWPIVDGSQEYVRICSIEKVVARYTHTHRVNMTQHLCEVIIPWSSNTTYSLHKYSAYLLRTNKLENIQNIKTVILRLSIL